MAGGGDGFFLKIKNRSSSTGTGTNAGVTVTVSAPVAATDKLSCGGVQCSSDAAAVVTIESPASTVLWQKRFPAAFTHSESFPIGTVLGAAGQALLVKVSASTAHSEANIQTFTVSGA